MENTLIDSVVVKECMLKHPEAENEIVAVDLEAQAAYSEIQDVFGKEPQSRIQLRITRYNYLRDLREHLNNKRVEQLSDFVVKN